MDMLDGHKITLLLADVYYSTSNDNKAQISMPILDKNAETMLRVFSKQHVHITADLR